LVIPFVEEDNANQGTSRFQIARDRFPLCRSQIGLLGVYKNKQQTGCSTVGRNSIRYPGTIFMISSAAAVTKSGLNISRW